MEEKDKGVMRRMRGSPTGMDEKDEEGITLKLFLKKIKAFSQQF